MMKEIRELVMLFVVALCSKLTASSGKSMSIRKWQMPEDSYCLSWRLGVETNNIRAWRIVPNQCLRYVENYMMLGQYERDVDLIIDQVMDYVNDDVVLSNDGFDAWILDVDDTCISNLFYYQRKRFGYVNSFFLRYFFFNHVTENTLHENFSFILYDFFFFSICQKTNYISICENSLIILNIIPNLRPY